MQVLNGRPLLIAVLTLVSSLLIPTAEASTIIYQGRGTARVLDNSNNFLPDGSLVLLGKFPAGFDPVANASNPALVKSQFVVLDSSSTATESGRVGTINDSLVQTGLGGTKLYLWVYNSSSVATSTQHGLFTKASWVAPTDDPPFDSITASLSSDSLEAVIGSVSTAGKLTPLAASPSYTSWASSHFNGAQLADPNISGDAATPAGDGVSNLLKYAYGLPPLTPIAASARPSHSVQPVSGSNYVGITFRRNRSAPDLTFEVQFSDASGTWPNGASSSQTVSVTDLGDGSDLVTIRDTVPFAAGQPARLARVKVTKN